MSNYFIGELSFKGVQNSKITIDNCNLGNSAFAFYHEKANSYYENEIKRGFSNNKLEVIGTDLSKIDCYYAFSKNVLEIENCVMDSMALQYMIFSYNRGLFKNVKVTGRLRHFITNPYPEDRGCHVKFENVKTRGGKPVEEISGQTEFVVYSKDKKIKEGDEDSFISFIMLYVQYFFWLKINSIDFFRKERSPEVRTKLCESFLTKARRIVYGTLLKDRTAKELKKFLPELRQSYKNLAGDLDKFMTTKISRKLHTNDIPVFVLGLDLAVKGAAAKQSHLENKIWLNPKVFLDPGIFSHYEFTLAHELVHHVLRTAFEYSAARSL